VCTLLYSCHLNKRIYLRQIQEINELKTELAELKCSMDVILGMAKRGYSAHDVDLLLSLRDHKLIYKIMNLLRIYGRKIMKKYNLELEAIIVDDHEKVHFFSSTRHPCFILDIERYAPPFLNNPLFQYYVSAAREKLKQQR
jgi:hypothetical protein